MHLHNFIVDHRNEDLSLRESLDFEVFDDDCRRFYAVNPFLDNEGVYGGEEDVHRKVDGSILMGGQPNRAEAISTEIGKDWRNKHRDEIRI